MNRRGFLGFLAAIPALPLLSKLKGGKVLADPQKVGDAIDWAAVERDQFRLNVASTLQWRRLCQADGEYWRIDSRPLLDLRPHVPAFVKALEAEKNKARAYYSGTQWLHR